MDEQTTVSAATKEYPTNVALLVFPTFEPLDAFGPLEAFSMLTWKHKINLYIISDTLDPASTKQLDKKFDPHGSAFDIRVLPTHTLDNPPEDIEVLLVPGGVGAMSPNLTKEIDFIRKTYPKLKYLIMVCNGAGLAAQAGVLDGKRATTNKAAWKTTTAMGPNVKWVKTARYCVDGNCWTSGGVSAGIDTTLAWMAHVYGRETAREAANRMEYEWRDDKDWDPFSTMFGEGQ